MPLPRWVARVNKATLNRVTRMIAGRAPGWAVVVHRGRTSGRVYRTPVFAFHRDGTFVIALTYGAGTDWTQNVLAAGGCELESRRTRHEVANPRVHRDEQAKDVPPLIGSILRHVIGATEFLHVDIVDKAVTDTD